MKPQERLWMATSLVSHLEDYSSISVASNVIISVNSGDWAKCSHGNEILRLAHDISLPSFHIVLLCL